MGMVRDSPAPLPAMHMHPRHATSRALHQGHLPQGKGQGKDWSQPALTRTWRTLSLMAWSGGLLCAFGHWPLPAVGLCLLGLWAHAKRQACQG